jgi:uncharacterized metal-binding protein YceD (DUF177 family)
MNSRPKAAGGPKISASHAFTRKVAVASLPKTGQHVVLTADDAACVQIAGLLGLPRVDALSVTVEVRPVSGGRYRVEGQVSARLWQTCVVSLEDFPSDVAAEIEAVFADADRLPPVSKKEVERTLADEDPPEPLVDGMIDVAALAVEFIALALEPFPRRPGAALDAPSEHGGPESPFAALAALKQGLP